MSEASSEAAAAQAAGGVRAAIAGGRYAVVHLLLVPVALAMLALALQYGRLDIALAHLFFGPVGQVDWRDSMWLDILGHQGARIFPMVVGAVVLVLALASGLTPRLRSWRTILLTLGATMIVGPMLINWLKTMTAQSCPSAMLEFGGGVDYLLNRQSGFWAGAGIPAGRCLPSAHAGGGYALLALYFAGWAAGRPRWRWRGLAIGIATGLAFAAVRMLQGAHFASATVWSATVAWTVCAIVFMPLLCRAAARPL